MSDNKVWRCPQCETINHTNFCVVCGKKRPVETDNNKGTAEYIQKNKELNSSMDKLRSALDDQQEKKNKYGTVKKKDC